jgi:hypothetical protein
MRINHIIAALAVVLAFAGSAESAFAEVNIFRSTPAGRALAGVARHDFYGSTVRNLSGHLGYGVIVSNQSGARAGIAKRVGGRYRVSMPGLGTVGEVADAPYGRWNLMDHRGTRIGTVVYVGDGWLVYNESGLIGTTSGESNPLAGELAAAGALVLLFDHGAGGAGSSPGSGSSADPGSRIHQH